MMQYNIFMSTLIECHVYVSKKHGIELVYNVKATLQKTKMPNVALLFCNHRQKCHMTMIKRNGAHYVRFVGILGELADTFRL